MTINHTFGLAALAALLLLPGLANASCPTATPSFNYTPVAKGGGQAVVGINAQAGCLWEVVSSSPWIRIVSANHGYGYGQVVFQILPNPNRAARRGSFGAPARCGDTIPGRSSVVCAGKFSITVDQSGY